VRKIDANTYVANARAELDEVRDVVGSDFDAGESSEEIDTIGGLVFDLVGRVPVKGEIITGLKGFEFEVLQSDSRQLKRLKIKRVAKPARRKVVPGGEEKAAAE
jgi:CBS domain containing-hemolysin-like protein